MLKLATQQKGMLFPQGFAFETLFEGDEPRCKDWTPAGTVLKLATKQKRMNCEWCEGKEQFFDRLNVLPQNGFC